MADIKPSNAVTTPRAQSAEVAFKRSGLVDWAVESGAVEAAKRVNLATDARELTTTELATINKLPRRHFTELRLEGKPYSVWSVYRGQQPIDANDTTHFFITGPLNVAHDEVRTYAPKGDVGALGFAFSKREDSFRIPLISAFLDRFDL